MEQEFILVHYGVKGQKWGVRRYQNPDGILSKAGKRRLAKEEYKKDVEDAYARLGKKKHYDKYENLKKGAVAASTIYGGLSYGALGFLTSVAATATIANGKRKAAIILGSTLGSAALGSAIEFGAAKADRNKVIRELGIKSVKERLKEMK